jgi:predicted metalloprotease with PDZ domain
MGYVGSGEKVISYELNDIVAILNELADYEWKSFFERRVSSPLESLPTEVVDRCGYRLNYATNPSSYLEYLQQGSVRQGFLSARDSLGLTFSSDGKISSVIPGMSGDAVRLAPGMQVRGVNDKKFSRERLHDALAESTRLGRIELLIEDGEALRTIVLNYNGGPRYLELVRNTDKPDRLFEIMQSRHKHKTGPASE